MNWIKNCSSASVFITSSSYTYKRRVIFVLHVILEYPSTNHIILRMNTSKNLVSLLMVGPVRVVQ